jgi:hypothetical protein
MYMLRQMALLFVLTGLALPLFSQDSGSRDKSFDVRSSVGDLHMGGDADAKKVGLPLYPGARLKSGDENNNQANLSIFTEAFGMKLVVANYVSDDAPSKVVDFYRDKLKKYGKVLECHSQKHGGNVEVHDDDKDSDKTSGKNKELKCDEDSGPVTELKVGTEDNQHIVAVEPSDGKGAHFALVYVHTRGKQGEI